MIEPSSQDGGSAETHESFIQLDDALMPSPKFLPNSNYIRLDYEKPLKAGEIILPGQAKGLEWITAFAIECGPECKLVKPGNKVLLAAKGMVNGKDGVLVEGRKVFFTQENMVVAVLEDLPVAGKD